VTNVKTIKHLRQENAKPGGIVSYCYSVWYDHNY